MHLELDEADLDSVTHEAGGFMDVKLGHEVSPMGLHGLNAHAELL